jgi:general secretion pathway protein D
MLFLRPIVIRNQADADKLTMNRYDAIRSQQTGLLPDKSLLMRINDAPVLPVLKPNTHVDSALPVDPQTESVPMPSVSPIPDLRTPAAPVQAPSTGASGPTK